MRLRCCNAGSAVPYRGPCSFFDAKSWVREDDSLKHEFYPYQSPAELSQDERTLSPYRAIPKYVGSILAIVGLLAADVAAFAFYEFHWSLPRLIATAVLGVALLGFGVFLAGLVILFANRVTGGPPVSRWVWLTLATLFALPILAVTIIVAIGVMMLV